jgi:hypothetical protein
MNTRRLVTFVALLLCCAAPARAQAVKLEFHDGKVNLTTQNAPLRTILTEWARLGGTRMVNLEKINGAPVTLQLANVSETQALDTILRGVAGYVAGQRPTIAPTQSTFDTIMLVPTAGTAALAASARPVAAPYSPPPAFQPPQPDPDDDPVGDVPPDDDRRPPPPGARRNQPPPDEEPAAQPAPTPAPGNPFGTPTGSAVPGTISPVPQQPQRPRSQPDNEP